jgi:hypothetical protein
MRSRRDLTAIGDVLVSIEAQAVPTHVLRELLDRKVSEYQDGQMTAPEAAGISSWIARIALQKLDALEALHDGHH